MKENKLIAEFMGLQFNKGTMYNMGYDVFADGNLYRTHELKYHTSWDWLMPVVNKCMKSGDNTNEWDALYDALSTVNITNIYDAVVEFIKQYNNERNK